MTGQRAHNMASLVTQCSGDAPGTGTGVVSGTVGSVCHPKSHSDNVRIRGQWAIRHRDEWWMNNRNTVGKLTYLRTQETFAPTPAIVDNNTPGSQVPPEHIQLADASPNWAEYLGFVPPEPATLPDVCIPGTTGTPPTPAPAPLPPPEDNRHRRPPAPQLPAPGLNLLGYQLRLIREAFGSLQRQAQIYEEMKDAVGRPPLIGPDGMPQVDMRTNEQRLQDMLDQMGVDSMPELDIKTADQQRALENLDTLRDMPAEPTGGNVRTTDRDDDNGGRDCRLRKYSEGCAPPYSTPHHVVADRVFRHPGTNTPYPGGVPHADGLSICVSNGTPIRRGGNMNEHGRIHILQDAGERYLGCRHGRSV